MVQKSSIVDDGYILLMQTKDRSIEFLLSNSVKDEDIRIETVENPGDLKEQDLTGQIITFIIGSDVEDPIQSAQRLHAIKKSARIIILSRSEKIESLKKVINFTPFIGTEIFCLDESDKAELKTKLKEILHDSLQAEKFRSIKAESNSQIYLQSSFPKTAFNKKFITKLMDIAPIGIAVVDVDGNVLGWNREAVSIFNKNEDQVLDTPLSQHFGNVAGSKLEDYIRESFNQRNSDLIDPLSLERKAQNMSNQVLSLTAAPFTYSDGIERALILVFKDVTQTVALLDQLKTEVNARDNFLGMASHELRTPLTAMRFNLELLMEAVKQDFPNASGFLELNHKSLKQADQLDELIEDLFDVAKIHSGKLDYKLEKINLSEFVRDYMLEIGNKFNAVNSELELDIEPNVTGVWDRNRIEQAFSNLINNTLKYAPDTPVKVMLKTRGNWAFLSIRDQGPGIPEDQQQKIFDRFERAAASNTISGLGLGLYIAKKIVEGHNGKVMVQSTPGKGSTFTLKLPMDLDPGEHPERLGVFW